MILFNLHVLGLEQKVAGLGGRPREILPLKDLGLR